MKYLGVLKNLIKNDSVLLLKLEFGGVFSVLDPDLAIRGGGGGVHPNLYLTGGAVSNKKFSALWASVWSKIKGGLDPPPLNPPLVFLV